MIVDTENVRPVILSAISKNGRILSFELNGKRKMTYYLYRNWVADKKAVIHRASCGHCNGGKGGHRNLLGDKNGKWFGPYPTIEAAQKEARQTYEGIWDNELFEPFGVVGCWGIALVPRDRSPRLQYFALRGYAGCRTRAA